MSNLVAGLDAILQLNPADAFGAGLDVATSAASVIDPLAFLGL